MFPSSKVNRKARGAVWKFKVDSPRGGGLFIGNVNDVCGTL